MSELLEFASSLERMPISAVTSERLSEAVEEVKEVEKMAIKIRVV